MTERPILDKKLDEKTFRNFYYLKAELVDFCKTNGLSSTGGKIELTDRIAHYLDTGEILSPAFIHKQKAVGGIITEDAAIEPNFVCSEKHRAFFKDKLGKSFSFNVAFQKWLKANAGKTYGQAIEAYRRIVAEKKRKVTVIDKQFEYNTYIRAFFADNPGKALNQAIVCWKYKKTLPGHNRYEKSDLAALDLR
jgi:dTDP-glucose pyrophosphorylase